MILFGRKKERRNEKKKQDERAPIIITGAGISGTSCGTWRSKLHRVSRKHILQGHAETRVPSKFDHYFHCIISVHISIWGILPIVQLGLLVYIGDTATEFGVVSHANGTPFFTQTEKIYYDIVNSIFGE